MKQKIVINDMETLLGLALNRDFLNSLENYDLEDYLYTFFNNIKRFDPNLKKLNELIHTSIIDDPDYKNV